MRVFRLILKVCGPLIMFIGLCHIGLGQGADALLGAVLSAPIDPVLDSQNRFYGSVFMCYGALMWLCATDMLRYRVVLQLLLVFMFVGGLARLISISLTGMPSAAVLGLVGIELIMPLPFLLWQRQVLRGLSET